MTICSFHIHTKSLPVSAGDVALIRIDPTYYDGKPEVSIQPGRDGFYSVSTLCAMSGRDIISVMDSFLHNLDFCNEPLKVALYSGQDEQSVKEAAYIAHILYRTVPMKTEDEQNVAGFILNCEIVSNLAAEVSL
jgi:hypothetical protein